MNREVQPMNPETVDGFRRKLMMRADLILHRRRRMLAEEDDLLQNREIDWEDLAADQAAAARLEALTEADAQALAQIRRSLDRLERGAFGNCLVCGGAIETERLRAMPEVERCAGCTH